MVLNKPATMFVCVQFRFQLKPFFPYANEVLTLFNSIFVIVASLPFYESLIEFENCFVIDSAFLLFEDDIKFYLHQHFSKILKQVRKKYIQRVR